MTVLSLHTEESNFYYQHFKTQFKSRGKLKRLQ